MIPHDELGLSDDEPEPSEVRSDVALAEAAGTIFIVHGHDGGRQNEVSHVVERLTGDDVGRALTEQSEQPRARQNVVFEAGFFIGRLGRGRVVLLYEAGVDLPSDLSGVLYRELDDAGRWHYDLGKELRHAGIDTDLNCL